MPDNRTVGVREFVCGFETGQNYANAPTTGDIVTDATAKHTGNYGLHCTIPSGVASTLTLALGFSAADVSFYRVWVKFVSLPSSSRVFICQDTSVTSRINLRITSAGLVELRFGTTVLGTRASALGSDWHYVEFGMSVTNNAAKLRIDGNTEVDWVAVGGSAGFVGSLVIGCTDTVAAAFQFYADDVAADSRAFPGYGRVKMLKMFDVASDNAAWALTGTTKPAAVDPGTTFDDTTFLACSTTPQTIMFGFDTLPTDVVQLYGLQLYLRAKRTGASSPAITPATGWRGGGTEEHALTTAGQLSIGASFAVQAFPRNVACSIFGGWFPNAYKNTLTVGFTSRNTNGVNVSAFWAEIDYSDLSAALPQDKTLIVADFEGNTTAELDSTNATTSGTLALVQTWAKFGASSLQLTHASGGRSFIRHSVSYDSTLAICKILNVSLWTKITTRQSSGNMSLWYWIENATFRFELLVNATGGLIANIDGTSSAATANDTIAASTEAHIAIELILGTASTSASCKVWVNDVLVLTHTAACATTNFGSVSLFHLGARSNVTGGAVVCYDGYVLDGATRHTSSLKVITLAPTGAGALTIAGFTANGAANKWDCLDDRPGDSDTTYVGLPAGLGTTSRESYALTDAPANLLHPLSCAVVWIVYKAESTVGGSIVVGFRWSISPMTEIVESAGFASSAAYQGTNIISYNFGGFGKPTPALITALEATIKQTSNTIAQRITAVGLTIAYTTIEERPANRGLKAQFVG
jgi:hypothetical protein